MSDRKLCQYMANGSDIVLGSSGNFISYEEAHAEDVKRRLEEAGAKCSISLHPANCLLWRVLWSGITMDRYLEIVRERQKEG